MNPRGILLLLATLLIVACSAGQSPAAPLLFDTGVNPDTWVTVPAGEFLFGQHNQHVNIPYAYEIMVTDVTNAQYATYLNKALADGKVKIAGNQVVGYYPGDRFTGKRHEKEIRAGDYLHVPIGDPDLRLAYDGKSFSVKSGYANHPVVAITWFGAKAYCEYFGWQLPTEIEWEKARAAPMDARILGATTLHSIKPTFTPAAIRLKPVVARKAIRRRSGSTMAKRTTVIKRWMRPVPTARTIWRAMCGNGRRMCTRVCTIVICAAEARGITSIICACGRATVRNRIIMDPAPAFAV